MEELKIYLEDSREVSRLKARVAELEGELARSREETRTAEFRYRCESVVNQELLDLCREHGVRYRPSLKSRPWGDDVPTPP